jgi:hypothetical protein
MGQGEAQFAYEPPRTVPGFKGRSQRVKMLGNGVVPQCASAAFAKLLSILLQAQGNFNGSAGLERFS